MHDGLGMGSAWVMHNGYPRLQCREKTLHEAMRYAVLGAGNYVLAVCRNGDRTHLVSSGVAPERGAAVLVEKIDVVVTGANGDVLSIR